MVFDYAGSAWGVIGVGGARLTIDVDNDSYAAVTRIRTGGIAALFLQTQIDANASGVIDRSGAVRWQRYYLDHIYDGVHRFITMRRRAPVWIRASIRPIQNGANHRRRTSRKLKREILYRH